MRTLHPISEELRFSRKRLGLAHLQRVSMCILPVAGVGPHSRTDVQLEECADANEQFMSPWTLRFMT